jgi:hypothetical protein
MPNGVLVGDVVLLINPGDVGDDNMSVVATVLAVAALVWLEILDFIDVIPGRRRQWVLSASQGGRVLARRTFASRQEAHSARERIAARGVPSTDWQASLDAA